MGYRRGILARAPNGTYLDAEDRATGLPLLRRPERSANLLLAARPRATGRRASRALRRRAAGPRLGRASRAPRTPSYFRLDLAARWRASAAPRALRAGRERRRTRSTRRCSATPRPGARWIGGLAIELLSCNRREPGRPSFESTRPGGDSSLRQPAERPGPRRPCLCLRRWPPAGAARGGPPRPARGPRASWSWRRRRRRSSTASGAADRIVAVGDFVEWPPAVARLPQVGAYDSPSVERVLELEADLLVTAESRAGGAVHDRLARLGVEVLELDTETYRGVLDAVASAGAAGSGASRRPAPRRSASAPGSRRSARAAAAPPRRRVLVRRRARPALRRRPGLAPRRADRGGRRRERRRRRARRPSSSSLVEAALERRPEVIVDISDNRPGAPRGPPAGPLGAAGRSCPRCARAGSTGSTRPGSAIPGPRLPEMALLMAPADPPRDLRRGRRGRPRTAAPAAAGAPRR